MAKRCALCGKGKIAGHNVSYSKRRTGRVFRPNLHQVRLNDNTKIKVCMDCLGKLKEKGKLFKRVEKIAKVAEVAKVSQVPQEVEKVEKAVKAVASKKRGRPKKQTTK